MLSSVVRRSGRSVSLAALLLTSIIAGQLEAQGSASLTGKVTDEQGGAPIVGARVTAGTGLGVSTRADGTYRLTLAPGTYDVRVTSIGHAMARASVTIAAGEEAVRDFSLTRQAVELQEVAVIGTRAAERSATDAPVPVDVLTAAEIKQSGRTETAQIIQMLAPSFNFPRSTVADGTDHSRPATLRGLAPDQVLVLLNGKRRHTSALINVNGTVGRGSGMVDLNAIPASAIDRIEILRDGAAAQYGSDAIAGVINIILKAGAQNELSAEAGQTVESDGGLVVASANYAAPLGRDGVLQLSGEFRDRGFTNRTLADPRAQYFRNDPKFSDPAFNNLVNHRQGDADTRDGSLFLNLSKPVSPGAEIYAFGGGSWRKGEAAGFFRRALDDRTVRSIHPDGFLPLIATTINDYSGVAGARGSASGLRWDLSATYGRNSFDFNVKNSNNVSIGPSSKTDFFAGTLGFNQFTANLDVSKGFEAGLAAPVNVAAGAEFRRDGYEIVRGEPDSYRNGGAFVLDSLGNPTTRPGAVGAQVFPGFRPNDEVDASRNNVAGYVDVELRPVAQVLLGVAGRAEHYNDFGGTTTGKATIRIEPTPGLAVRGAISSGFRAPSLGQSHFSATATNNVAGIGLIENRTFPVSDPIAVALGARPLSPERSTNLSAGLVITPAELKNFSLTVDYYQIKIRDRIVLSGNFTGAAIRTFLTSQGFSGVDGGRYFTNAVDTRTRGLDAVANYGVTLSGAATLRLTGGYNLNRNLVTHIDSTPPALSAFQAVLFDRVEEGRMENGQPRHNVLLVGDLSVGEFGFTLRNQRFGEVSSYGTPTNGSLDQEFSAKWITDVSASYKFANRLTLRAGVDNVFDVYPDINNNPATLSATTAGNSNFGIFPYNGLSPFGFNGAFYFMRASVTF